MWRESQQERRKQTSRPWLKWNDATFWMSRDKVSNEFIEGSAVVWIATRCWNCIRSHVVCLEAHCCTRITHHALNSRLETGSCRLIAVDWLAQRWTPHNMFHALVTIQKRLWLRQTRRREAGLTEVRTTGVWIAALHASWWTERREIVVAAVFNLNVIGWLIAAWFVTTHVSVEEKNVFSFTFTADLPLSFSYLMLMKFTINLSAFCFSFYNKRIFLRIFFSCCKSKVCWKNVFEKWKLRQSLLTSQEKFIAGFATRDREQIKSDSFSTSWYSSIIRLHSFFVLIFTSTLNSIDKIRRGWRDYSNDIFLPEFLI